MTSHTQRELIAIIREFLALSFQTRPSSSLRERAAKLLERIEHDS